VSGRKRKEGERGERVERGANEMMGGGGGKVEKRGCERGVGSGDT